MRGFATSVSGRWFGSLFGRSKSPARQFASSQSNLINSTEKIEEENWEWYKPDTYYPVRIGETFDSRYQVLGKLGYGAHSTAWLGRDLQAHRSVTLKLCERGSVPAKRERDAYGHLNSLSTSHAGSLAMRQLLDSFTVEAFGGEYLCMVHEPLAFSVRKLQRLMLGGQLSEDVLKSVLKYLLTALDYLHSEAKMVHADLQASNIHFRAGNDDIFTSFEQEELKNPSPRKIDGDCIIYESRDLQFPKQPGHAVLCDFGEARYGKASYTDDIQPYVYRAPEVILDIPWSFEVDIWNVGVLIWDLFEKKHLFNAKSPTGEQLSEYHLAEMVAILGPPPLDYLRRTDTSWEYFADDGTWTASATIPDISLESSEVRLDGANKIEFLQFVRKMLQWCPERRSTAKQLLDDPWLNS